MAGIMRAAAHMVQSPPNYLKYLKVKIHLKEPVINLYVNHLCPLYSNFDLDGYIRDLFTSI